MSTTAAESKRKWPAPPMQQASREVCSMQDNTYIQNYSTIANNLHIHTPMYALTARALLRVLRTAAREFASHPRMRHEGQPNRQHWDTTHTQQDQLHTHRAPHVSSHQLKTTKRRCPSHQCTHNPCFSGPDAACFSCYANWRPCLKHASQASPVKEHHAAAHCRHEPPDSD